MARWREAGEAARIVPLGKWVGTQVVDRGIGQGVVGDVHVVGMVVGHGPDDAELVGQIVPQPAVARPLDDAAVVARRRAGRDVPRVHVEPLEHRLARPGELLHVVHDHQRIVDPQMLQKGLVGRLVDAGLVPTQVDRHAVGDLVVQCRQHPLARSHGLFGHDRYLRYGTQ